MPENKNVSKVVYGEKILIDLTADTVTPDQLMLGATAHDSSGTLITGSLDVSAEHRLCFRGKNLGESFTDEHKSAVTNGTFTDIFLGDSWLINGVTWRIVDMDYWYNQGDTAFTSHHLVIMPDQSLGTASMNASNVSEGGYAGSLMYSDNLEAAKTIIQNAFGTALLTHRTYLVNAVSEENPSRAGWYDSTVELPNEIMMYGSLVCSLWGSGGYTSDKTQLTLMRVVPRYINPYRENCWLRDIAGVDGFAAVWGDGRAGYGLASSEFGIRPVFAIG